MTERYNRPPRRASGGDHHAIVSLDSLLNPALTRMGVRQKVTDERLRIVVQEILGPAIAPMCDAVTIERRTVVMATSHPAVSHQLQMDMPRIVELINERMGFDCADRIRFVPRSSLGK